MVKVNGIWGYRSDTQPFLDLGEGGALSSSRCRSHLASILSSPREPSQASVLAAIHVSEAQCSPRLAGWGCPSHWNSSCDEG